MRIVLSNSSSKWGGVHKATEILARGFQQRGHDVTVFGYPDGMLEERMKPVAPFEPIMKGMDLHPITMVNIRKALKKHGADVLLAMMKKDVRLSVPAARMSGIPSVVRHANDRALDGGLYDRAFFGTMPSHHIVNSNATRNTLLESAPWIDAGDVSVIYNGIDPSPYEFAQPVDPGVPAGSFKIGFVGRLEIRKGFIDLAHAWHKIAAALPDAWLVIAGTGADEAKARTVFAGAPRVKWLGYRSDIPSILKSIDLLVVPSHWEGFGYSAAEGMAAGVPTIAANASSLAEIVEDGVSGRLVSARNPDALAQAIIDLERDPALRAQLGAGGRKRITEAFGLDRMVDGYEEVLSRVAKAGK